MGEVAAVRESFYWEHFDEEERALLLKAGFRPEEADAVGGIDGELVLLRVLVRRLMTETKGDKTGRSSEAVSRLIERLGRVLKARQALGGDSTLPAEFLGKVGSEVLEHERATARDQATAASSAPPAVKAAKARKEVRR